MLQRLSEDLEYYELLDKAAKCQSSLEQMCYVAAFTVSSYSTTVHRTGKPFNPLLGETFELDRLKECGYRSLCEQACWDQLWIFYKLNQPLRGMSRSYRTVLFCVIISLHNLFSR